MRYRYYVSGSLITKDRTENSAALRIPAAEIEELVSDRVQRWLLDPGSIYKSTAARLADPSNSTGVSSGPQRSPSTGPSCPWHASVPSSPS